MQDTLCGYVVPDNDSTIPSVYDTINTICDWWELNRYPSFNAEFDLEHNMLLNHSINNTNTTTTTTNTTANKSVNSVDDNRKLRLNKWMKWYVCFYCNFSRQQKVNQRNLNSIIMTSYMLLFFGVVVSNLVGNIALPNIKSGGQLAAQVTSGTLVYTLLG